MAISGVNKKRADAISQEANADKPVIGQAHAQPPAFRATGRGLANRLPDFPATAANANGSLVNRATPPKNGDLHKLYLFVDAIQTGFALAGETGQAQLGRVFYPRNLSQDELVIEGTVANQYEYDRLVRFVEHHHSTQFSSKLAVSQSLDGNDLYRGVDFKLFKPVNSHLSVFKPLKFGVVITDMAAGAERYKFARTFSLQCKVTYDYLSKAYHLEQGINTLVTRQRVFGSATDPSPTTGTTSSTPKSAQAAASPKTNFNQR